MHAGPVQDMFYVVYRYMLHVSWAETICSSCAAIFPSSLIDVRPHSGRYRHVYRPDLAPEGVRKDRGAPLSPDLGGLCLHGIIV